MNKLYSVHDHWTDISKKNDVDIESIDGVIAGIKVNGEDYGGGSSDFSTANVTLTRSLTISLPECVDELGGFCIASDSYEAGTYIVPLYKGHCRVYNYDDRLVVEGNAEIITEESTGTQYIDIYGDCTIRSIS